MNQILKLFGDRLAPNGSLVADNFASWFGGSRILDAFGAPLVVYHGTKADFSAFESRSPTSVFQLDGCEIRRVDSWDMGDDRSGEPEAFHYGAISDVGSIGAAEALKMRLADAQRHGSNDADTLRRIRDLERMLGKAFSQHTENRPTGDGFYFTPNHAYSFIRDAGYAAGGNVMPVYLNIRNPAILNAAQIEGAASAFQVQKRRAQGFDGAIFANYPDDLGQWGFGGGTQIVAFDACQIKSAVGNSGAFDSQSTDMTDAYAWNAPAERERMRA